MANFLFRLNSAARWRKKRPAYRQKVKTRFYTLLNWIEGKKSHGAAPAKRDLIKCEKVCPIIAQSCDFESENNRFSFQLSAAASQGMFLKCTKEKFSRVEIAERRRRSCINCIKEIKSRQLTWIEQWSLANFSFELKLIDQLDDVVADAN